MEISGSSAFYSGLSTIQAGQNRVDQAAGKIASAATSQPSDAQNDRLQAVNRGPEAVADLENALGGE